MTHISQSGRSLGERGAGDLAGQLRQLAAAAGRGRADPEDVVVEVEVRILDPHRVGEPERHLAASRRVNGGTRCSRLRMCSLSVSNE